MKIEKKTWPEEFEAIWTGKKNFDLRLADFECHPGDILVLREWDPKTKKYTGRKIEKEVTYVGRWKIGELYWPEEEIRKHGLQVISLK